MVKNSEMKAAIDRALARMDAKRTARRRAAGDAARQVGKRRDKEKRIAKAQALRPKRKRARRLELAGWKILTARMVDDTWYEFGQLRALIPEYARGSAKAWVMQGLPKRGLIERAGNPDFDPGAAHGSKTPARYLYKLSATGEMRAAEWRGAIGPSVGTSE